ncbi:MAG: WYL domain-containing transcriptional regulator [Chloroflexota bacterium]
MLNSQCRQTSTPGRLGLWRIYRIDAYIRNGTYPNVPRLAEKLEVSRRTIERDLAYLRDLLNAPLAYNRERNGYSYNDSFQLPPLNLTEGEVLALFLSSRVLSQYRGSPYERLIRDAFEKICAALPETLSPDFALVNETLSFNVEPLRGDERQLLKAHQTLLDAIRNRNTVELDYYTASRDEHNTRRLDPYHLRYHGGAWYLIAYCHWRGQTLIFALDRISNLRLTEHHFQPDPDFDIHAYLGDSLSLERGGEVEEVRIKFDPFQARYIRERQWHPSQEITEHPDGSLTLILWVRGLGEVKRWIMSLGHHAEVLAPDRLRMEVLAEVERMGEMYGIRAQ